MQEDLAFPQTPQGVLVSQAEATQPEAGIQPSLVPVLSSLIQEAVQRDIANEMQRRTSSWLSDQAGSQGALQNSQGSVDLDHFHDRGIPGPLPVRTLQQVMTLGNQGCLMMRIFLQISLPL